VTISDEEIIQRFEWRTRLIKTVIGRKHDDEILIEMLTCGLALAHSEGVLDCAAMLDTIADKATGNRDRFVARTLAKSMRDYNEMNVADRKLYAL
jgi:hypothetical protein